MTKRKDGKLSVEVVATSDEVTSIAEGWNTNVWCVAEYRDTSGKYPAMKVRAELIRSNRRVKAVVTELVLGADGKPVLPRQVSQVARMLPDLAADVLSLVTLAEGKQSTPRQFIHAMNAAMRRPNQTQFEREDEVLQRWENEYQPKGMNQREAAEAMNMTHSTFRTYLAHARARRK